MSDMVKMAVAGVLALRRGSEALRGYRGSPGGDRESHRVLRCKREFQQEFLRYQEGYDPGADVTLEQIRDITCS